MKIPTEMPATGRPAKKRALSKPIRDGALDELRAELRQFQSELRDALKALSEAISALNARVDSVESKVMQDTPSGSSLRSAPSSTSSSTVQAAPKVAQLTPACSISHGWLIEGLNHGGTR